MKKLFVLFFVLHSTLIILHSQSIRPIRDNVGFCWNANEMDAFMQWLDKNADVNDIINRNMIGAISVHDDYLYAGKVYYPLYKQIRTKEVVIFGVTHGTVRHAMGSMKDILILDEFDKWKGPYGEVGISPLREIIKSNLPKDYYIVSNKAHTVEHSIEALIPFLQYYNRDIKITPIMVTAMSFGRMDSISTKLSQIFSDYIKQNNLIPGKGIFFLISNDANHYGEDFNNSPYGLDLKAHQEATDNDRRILREDFSDVFNKNSIKNISKELWPDPNDKKPKPLWCGRYPIVMGLLTTEKTISEVTGKEINGKLFKYSDTMTEKVLPIKNTSMGLTAVFSPKHWCGWFTLGLYQY